jgi:hypothetical protein
MKLSPYIFQMILKKKRTVVLFVVSEFFQKAYSATIGIIPRVV